MNWDKFKNNIHPSWHEKLKGFVQSEECDLLYAHLKKDSKRGKQIAPLSEDVWKAFKLCPMDELKVVLMGMSPYHTFKNGLPASLPRKTTGTPSGTSILSNRYLIKGSHISM